MHIGLIGGIGPAATEFYYRGLVRAHAKENRKMSLTIVHADTREMVANMEAGENEKQARIFASYAEQLKAGSCERVVVTSMGGHFCIREFEKLSPLPVLNAIPELDAYFARLGVKRIGVLGSRVVMETKFYGGVSSVDVLTPAQDEIATAHKEYISMAMAVSATDAQKQYFDKAGRDLCAQGAELIVLGGTDLFLAFGDEDHGYPIVDSAQIHVDAIARVSMQG